MISKELLSEVFEENVISIDYTIDNNLTFTSYDNMWSGEYTKHVINIYELAHKCKEWAYKLGYNLISGMADTAYDGDSCIPEYSMVCIVNLRCGHHSYNSKFDKEDWSLDYEFGADTEPYAIFKACQLVLENK